ncbi:HDOD domain-containing protein [Spirochaeta isovalerica]|uniref:Putative nucleotidyltransferase with HDIG domain n=1 Tax=Spirochaeta isovalerica TaxID=150 RepID=A0A841RHC4_9SPIO|nr:putative nucleotidyltransferase with HDIG domain [Spirochaeta isovalerica]
MALNIDREKIIRAVRQSIPLAITTYKLPHETEMDLENVLGMFLKEMDQDMLKDRLAYRLRELAVNAKKANTKRVYFEDKGLDLANKEQYEEGMRNFKEETFNNLDYYLNLQKEKGLYIKIIFHSRGKKFKISIKNNVEINRKEQMRIYDRIARSRAFDSMEEAFAEVLDDSEGAGLGIVILILMLRKMGLDEESFEIEGENGVTTASITIPMGEVHLEKLELLTRQIVDEIEALPQFPDNIVHLQKLINDPDSEIAEIARRIATDPSLTADLLKTVNSAQFMLPNKVDNIADAVKMVGLRGLKNLLYSYGTEKILNFPEKKELWEHAHRTAYYSYNLARNRRLKKEMVDDAYIGGILHDMGKIVFSNVHPMLIERIQEFSTEKEIPGELFERLSAGYNHAEVGAKIAEKWNFPDSLVAAIGYHHNPEASPADYKPLVYTIYLANAICNLEKKEISFDQLDEKVLAFFRISNESQIKHIMTRLSKDFENERSKI